MIDSRIAELLASVMPQPWPSYGIGEIEAKRWEYRDTQPLWERLLIEMYYRATGLNKRADAYTRACEEAIRAVMHDMDSESHSELAEYCLAYAERNRCKDIKA